jgi:hypothetical protein
MKEDCRVGDEREEKEERIGREKEERVKDERMKSEKVREFEVGSGAFPIPPQHR